jgi:hypothetical protein
MPRLRKPKAEEIPTSQDENIVESESVDDGLEEQTPPTYSERFKNFLDRHDLRERTPSFYLYKFNSQYGSSESFVAKWDGDLPPDEENIGLQFGGGKYRMVMTIPAIPAENVKGTTRTVTFSISDRFDDLAENPLNGKRRGPYIPGEMRELIREMKTNTSAPGDHQNPFDMMERMLSLLLPLIAQNRQQGPDMGQVMTNMYTNMQEVMKKQLIDNIGMYSQMTKAIAAGSLPIDEPEIEEKEDTLIDKILPYVDQFLPKLLGSGPKAEATSSVIRSIPQFQTISKDRERLKTLISWLDQNHGPEKTNVVLKSLKLNRV